MKSIQSSDYCIQSLGANDSSLQNSYCIKKEKKQKLKQKKTRIYKKKSHGPWQIQEEEKFINFMAVNRSIFLNKETRKSNKIFTQMAKQVGTRSSEQCRSHHQKYLIRYLNFDSIIWHVKQKIEEEKRKTLISKNMKSQKIKNQQLLNPWISNYGSYPNEILGCYNVIQKIEEPKCLTKLEKQIRTRLSKDDEVIYQGIQQGILMLLNNREQGLQLKIFLNLESFFKQN